MTRPLKGFREVQTKRRSFSIPIILVLPLCSLVLEGCVVLNQAVPSPRCAPRKRVGGISEPLSQSLPARGGNKFSRQRICVSVCCTATSTICTTSSLHCVLFFIESNCELVVQSDYSAIIILLSMFRSAMSCLLLVSFYASVVLSDLCLIIKSGIKMLSTFPTNFALSRPCLHVLVPDYMYLLKNIHNRMMICGRMTGN